MCWRSSRPGCQESCWRPARAGAGSGGGPPDPGEGGAYAADVRDVLPGCGVSRPYRAWLPTEWGAAPTPSESAATIPVSDADLDARGTYEGMRGWPHGICWQYVGRSAQTNATHHAEPAGNPSGGS